MSILIGHASIDENGRANSGQAGDQTGKEVCVRAWYNANWNVVLRPKSATVAEKMASACEILCNGNLVGYDQYQRNDLWDELAKVNWDPSALKVKTETDCSAFMTALAKIAGIEVQRVSLGNGKYNAPVTQTMRAAFGATGSFEVLTDSKYCTSYAYLKRGDILVRESGHTAMALGNGALSVATDDGVVVDYYGKVMASSLNCRSDPNGTIVGSYPNGAVVHISREKIGWGLTPDGWVSLDWIVKVEQPKETKEDDMDISKLTNKQCYEIMQKAQAHAATLPLPDWAVNEFNQAALDGITDGTRPQAFVTRIEAAIMADRAKGGAAK